MGIRDHLIHGPFAGKGPGRRQRKGNEIFEQGDRSPGRLTGIEVRSDENMVLEWRFGFEVEPESAPAFSAACRQTPPDEGRFDIRLEMPVEVHHADGDCTLGWDATGPGDWKPLKSVADGIKDVRLAKLKGAPSEATVVGWRQSIVRGMPSGNKDLQVEVDGGERTLEKAVVPEWAGHLLVAGTTLPVHLDGRRPVVDWLGAIERHGTGVGVPLPPPLQ